MKTLFALLGFMLPASDRMWARAIAAEVESLPAGAERVRLALSGAVALVRITARHALSRCIANAAMLAMAVAGGAAIGWIDVASSSRRPLLILVVVCCTAFGAAWPRCAVLGGALAGLAVAAMGRLAGSSGPYAFDTGDIWLPVVPCMLVSGLAAYVSRRVARRRQRVA